MRTLSVELGERSYPIYIGSDLLSDANLLNRHLVTNQVLMVSNEHVAPLYAPNLREAFTERKYSEVILPDGEAHKDLSTLNLIFDQLLRDGHNRGTTVIALGGGVVGDLAGFAAACYQRGVYFIQVPTTLLAQVDSSVGGKTGVNHKLGKNMIGAFYQPQCVIIDIGTLETLPKRELVAGIAEVVKYGIIADAEFFSWLEENYSALLELDPDALRYAIDKSCTIKAQVVAEDERESGIRAILNLGHTFGHAIETDQGYGKWLHGEAVATGMLMAADLSRREGYIDGETAARIRRLVAGIGLPVVPPPTMTEADFLQRMAVDKKVTEGQLRLVLVESLGKAIVTSQFNPIHLSATLAAGEALCC